MGEEGGGSGEVGALVEGEAPAAGVEEPEGAAAGVVLGGVGPPTVDTREGVGGQRDGVGDVAGVEVGDGGRGAWGVGLFGEEEGDDVGAGVEAAAGADLGEGLVEEGFEGGVGRADAGGEVGVFEGEEGVVEGVWVHGSELLVTDWGASGCRRQCRMQAVVRANDPE